MAVLILPLIVACADDAVQYYNLGVEARRAGQMSEAIRNWEKAVEIDPANVDARYNLGLAYFESELPEEALGQLGVADSLSPGDPETLYQMGRCLEALGRVTEARRTFSRAVGLRPDWAPARAALGRILYQQGLPDSAYHHARIAVRLRGSLVEGHNLLGRLLVGRGRLREAAREFTTALDLDPVNGNAVIGRGLVLIERRDFPEAIKEILEGMRMGGDYADGQTATGWAYYFLGDLPQAMTHFGYVLNRRPEYVWALYGMGRTRVEAGDPERAEDSLRLARRVLLSNGGSPELRSKVDHALGLALSGQGRYEDAIGVLEASLTHAGDAPLVEFALGEALIRAGRLERGRSILREFLEKWHGDRTYTTRALALLATSEIPAED
jgi:tetratricopeptide (TPR) repeat protein